MNKKILLSSLVAAGVLIPTMLTTNVNAAKIDAKSITSSISKENNDYILSVLLPVKEKNDYVGKKLDKDTVTKIVNAKFGTYDSVKEINNNRSDNAVGTGSVVKLNSNKELKVVLYGDLNGDGQIGTADSLSLSKHNTRKAEIKDSLKLKAAKLTKVNTNISTSDSVRLSKYNTNKLGSNLLINEELFPEDTVINSEIVLQGAADEINADSNSDFTITLNPDKKEGKLVFKSGVDDNKLIKDINRDKLVTTLINKLKEYKDSINEINLTFNSKTAKLTPNTTTKEAIINVAKMLLGENGDSSNARVSELYDNDLTVKFTLKENAEFIDKNNTDKDITYTLKFIKSDNYVKTVLKEAAQEVSNNNDKYTIEFNGDTDKKGTFKFKEGAKNESIATFKDLANTLVDYLNNEKAMLKNIELTFDGKNVTLTSGMSIQDIYGVAKELLNGIDTVENLISKNQDLKVKINLNDDNNKSEEYTLSFTNGEAE